MFWVVDNFLMRKRKKVKEDPNKNKVEARYFKLDNLKTTDDTHGSESEVLLSPDEENGDTIILQRETNERHVAQL